MWYVGSNATEVCSESSFDNHYLYMSIFIVAQFFNAYGGAALNLLVVPMLDENVKMKNLPLYAGKGRRIKYMLLYCFAFGFSVIQLVGRDLKVC